MQIYLVGGAVRDKLLNIEVKDRDWLVVGADSNLLIKKGYLPVGQHFPVFLHPETREEYALARSERKVGRGHGGFVFHAAADVTLEEDLSRRDLTINAMAMDDAGNIIDPFNGREDLQNRLLRHVSDAFVEDPLRILRTARFAAKFDFKVAAATRQLMCEMVQNGEINTLTTERVWLEIARGLMCAKPSLMFMVLRDCGALAQLLPEVDALFGVAQRVEYHPEIDSAIHTLMVVDCAAQMSLSLPERYAALCHDLGKALTPLDILPRHRGHEEAGVAVVKKLSKRLKAPKKCAQLATVVTANHGLIHKVNELDAATIVDVLQKTDAWRNPQRFENILNVCCADARGRKGFQNVEYPQKELWKQYLDACMAIDMPTLLNTIDNKENIAAAILKARCAAVTRVKNNI